MVAGFSETLACKNLTRFLLERAGETEPSFIDFENTFQVVSIFLNALFLLPGLPPENFMYLWSPMTRLRSLLSPFVSLKNASQFPQKLVEVPAGVRVRIRGFETMEGTETLRERGLCEEAEVRVLKAGDPLVCLVFGSRLILNRTIAEGILVEVLN